MIGAGHFHPAEFFHNVGNARIIRGHEDLAQRFRLPALLDDVLNERPARDERESGFAGEPRRGGNAREMMSKNFHGH